MSHRLQPSQITAAICLALLLVAESVAPFFIEQRRSWRRLLQHDLRNLSIGGFNALMPATLFTGLLSLVDAEAKACNFGLLRQLSEPAWLQTACAILLLDLWMYWWHRINHAVPFFWRYHRVHHGDPSMDASSGVRFHPGEIFLSGLVRLAVVPLLGISFSQVMLYQAILLPVVLLQHANVRLPRLLDFGFARAGLLVTPAMHRVHHSRQREETNSNYASVLPIWDRLFGTLSIRQNVAQIEFGLDELASSQSQTLAGMIKTPFTQPVSQNPVSPTVEEAPKAKADARTDAGASTPEPQ